MAAEKCKNCGHEPGKAFGLQHTTTSYQCRKCRQEFCSYCKKSGPACPSCGSTSVKKLGQLGANY